MRGCSTLSPFGSSVKFSWWHHRGLAGQTPNPTSRTSCIYMNLALARLARCICGYPSHPVWLWWDGCPISTLLSRGAVFVRIFSHYSARAYANHHQQQQQNTYIRICMLWIWRISSNTLPTGIESTLLIALDTQKKNRFWWFWKVLLCLIDSLFRRLIFTYLFSWRPVGIFSWYISQSISNISS